MIIVKLAQLIGLLVVTHLVLVTSVWLLVGEGPLDVTPW